MAHTSLSCILLTLLLGAGLPLGTLGTFSTFTTPAAFAQQERPAPAFQVKPFVPPTLKEALEKAAWSPEQRGPLLIIAPDVVVSRPLWAVRDEELRKSGANSTDLKPPFPVPASNGEYRVPELAEFYGRRLVRLNGITVLAPETMIVLNDNPGKLDIYADMPQDQKLQMFQASLNEGQWTKIGSRVGLGIGDLQGSQRDLYMALLPDPFSVLRGTAIVNGIQYAGELQPAKLVGNERLGVRLHMARTIRMALPQQGSTQVYQYVSSRQPGQEVLQLNNWDRERSKDTLFGQKLRMMVPTRLKPQQIDFDAAGLNARISLSGAKTVGALVERLRTATHQDIYVDPRIGKQSVWLRTSDQTTLRAGDLLRALCWGVAGAVRYIEAGHIFILTDDIAGWGTRVARIQAWISAGESLRQQQSQKFSAEIRKRSPLQYLKLDDKDPMAVKPERMAEIEGTWKTYRGRYSGISVPVESLNPEQQEIAKDSTATYNAQAAANQGRPIDTSRVQLTVQLRVLFSVPGVGDVEDSNSGWSMLNNLLPPPEQERTLPEGTPPSRKTITFPAQSPVGGVLRVMPKDAAQARAAVQAAREHGFKQVWILLPSARLGTLTPSTTDSLPDFDLVSHEGQNLLLAAIEESKSDPGKSISVLASVSLLTVIPGPASGQTSGQGIDYNIAGETAVQEALRQANLMSLSGREKYAGFLAKAAKEWLPPDTPGLLPRLKKYLLEIAATPGLAGMALTDTAASGYETAGSEDAVIYSAGNTGLGYVSAYRADFVRTAGCDPIDFASPDGGGSLDLSHPFLGESNRRFSSDTGEFVEYEGRAVERKWNAARFARAAELSSALYTALSSEKELLHKPPATPPGTMQPMGKGGATRLQGQFALYLRVPGDPYNTYLLWDQKEMKPLTRLALQLNPNTQAAFDALRLLSSQCLFCYPYVDPDLYQTTEQSIPPKTLAARTDQFAQGYNQFLSYRKGNWDGSIIDLTQGDLEKSLPLLSAVRGEPASGGAGKTIRP